MEGSAIESSGQGFVSAILHKCAADEGDGPRYARLAAAIEAAIGQGALLAGDRVPTEVELARRLPFGLGTIQKALNMLVDNGMLVRRRRMGTFVAATRRQRLDDLPNFTFERPDGTLITSVMTTVLGRARISGAGRWSQVLGEAEAGYVVFEERLDWIDDEPFCYVTFHASAAAFPALLDQPTEDMRQMLGWGGAPAGSLSIAAAAVPLPVRARELLGGTRGLGLRVEVVAADGTGGPLYLQTLHVPSEYRLVLARPR